MNKYEENLLLAASFVPNSLQFPPSWIGHIPFAQWLIGEIRPNIFVELGTHSGNSYFSFCQSVKTNGLNTKCFAIDSWGGDAHAGFYSEEIFQTLEAHNFENYSSFSTLIKMKFDDALSHFEDKSIDLLHIDGLHTYDAVSHDFYTWLPKLSSGAIVLLHDINVHTSDFGVWKLWEELQRIYPLNLQFLHSHGLGLIKITDIADTKSFEWLNPESISNKRILEYFTSIGNFQISKYNELENKKLSGERILKIQQLQDGISIRDQSIQQLQEGISSRDQSIQQLQEGISSRDQSIQQLQEGISSRDQQIEMLINTNLVSQNTISNIYKSTSWKLSHPIRFVGHQLKRVKVIYRTLPEILIRGGGLGNSISKAFKVYKNGGIGQVRSTLRFILTTSSNGSLTTETGEIVSRNDYQEWIKRYDTLTPEICAKIQDEILEFKNPPKISIVMPVYDPPLQFLDQAIWSVRNQLYQNWELCIADDCSKNEEVRVLLRKHASEDHRIKVVYREENGHISIASNSALDLATGEFVGLLDHDDILPIHALYKVVKTILQNPNVSLIYSDEDKIDNKGRRSDPYFKSDWNIEMQYSHNMFSHFGVYKRSILEEIQGFRIGLEGSQDYDLLLRCIEKVEEKNILHIPHVLYHWRIHSNSTAMSSDTKPYAMVAGEKALNEHFVRIGINGRVKLVDYGYSLHFNLPSNVPMVTIVIPTRNSKDLVIKCIHSIRQLTNYPSFEIILVDNGSDELDSLQEWKKLAEEGVCIIRDDSPFNYSALNNLAVAHAKGEVIVMLNNDTEVIDPKWLDILVSNAIRPGVGAVGARLIFPNNTIQHAGVVLGLGGAAGHVNIGLPAQHYGYFGKVQLASSFSAVTGACLAVRKELYELIGGLDEKNLPVSFNDVDFCLRLNSEGYRTVYAPNALLFHHESASRGPEDNEEKIKRFDESVAFMYKKWGKLIRNDPFYNPNLTLEFPDYSLAFPPRIKMV